MSNTFGSVTVAPIASVDIETIWDRASFLLDNIDEYILAVCPETLTIQCANRSFLDDFGIDSIGKACWETLFNKQNPVCEKCMKTAAVRTADHHKTHTHPNVRCLRPQNIGGRPIRFVAAKNVSPGEIDELLQTQSYVDPLTGLPNRQKYSEDLDAALAEAQEMGEVGYIISIDMDDFFVVNDSFGQEYGDEVLRGFAVFLREVVGMRHSVYRVGGDEFAIILRATPGIEINPIISQILKRVQEPWTPKNKRVYITASLGVVKFPDAWSEVHEIIRAADVALHQAKNSGKNNHVLYTPNTRDDAVTRIKTERKLRDAIADGCKGFCAYYQPLVAAEDQSVIGAEALLRWFDNEGNMIMPNEFIPLSEYLGLIVPLGEFIMREAAATCKWINDHGHPEFIMNINVSIRQFQLDDIAERIEAILTGVGVNFQNITLEITESSAVDDLPRLCDICAGLRAKGLRFAMDDFGTGFSSLNNLKNIPLDVIKIDRSFVRDVGEDDYKDSFIRLVAELGHVMNRKICVEGVENADQLLYCKSNGVDTIQGFHFYRPGTEDALMKLLNIPPRF